MGMSMYGGAGGGAGKGGSTVPSGGGGYQQPIPSDRRLKKNIRRIGTLRGYPWYSYDYIWDEPGFGVMSDEIPQEFVVNIEGYDHVDYGRFLA